LGKAAEILEKDAESLIYANQNAASKMVNLILNSDRIKFIVGTKINEVHQDPNMPVELEIRRNVVKRIASILQEKYLKEVSVSYF
ncbi:MAG: stage II sporulation protein E, partial [Treponemataceae bacterium]|nr:stage II sporulation protein E [Treponemataceae bacterium]